MWLLKCLYLQQNKSVLQEYRMRVTHLWQPGHLTALGLMCKYSQCCCAPHPPDAQQGNGRERGKVATQQRSPGMEPCVLLQPLPGCCRDPAGAWTPRGSVQTRMQRVQPAMLLLLLPDCISLFTLSPAPHESRKGLGPSTKMFSDVFWWNFGMKREMPQSSERCFTPM